MGQQASQTDGRKAMDWRNRELFGIPTSQATRQARLFRRDTEKSKCREEIIQFLLSLIINRHGRII